MGLSADTIAASIAALTISGVTIKDLDEFPAAADFRGPVLMPDPGQFMTDLALTVDSFGSTSGLKTISYNLNYIYLHAPVGQDRSLRAVYPGFVRNVCLILDALIDNDALSGCIDQMPASLSLGLVTDPSGVQFYGCPIGLRIQEFSEV
jgi:hypothetical protein